MIMCLLQECIVVDSVSNISEDPSDIRNSHPERWRLLRGHSSVVIQKRKLNAIDALVGNTQPNEAYCKERK